MSRVTHIAPLTDVINHDTTSAEPTCPCRPDVQTTTESDGITDYVLTHHSVADEQGQG